MLTDNGLLFMSTAIKNVRKDRDDAEWDGDFTRAYHLSLYLEELLERYEAGEQYEPNF